MSYIIIERAKINEEELIEFCLSIGLIDRMGRMASRINFFVVDTHRKVFYNYGRLYKGDIVANTTEEFKTLVKLGLL
jgi:hypothetical protein